MDFVKKFALKYLTNVDNTHPIQNKIISNGDCFFHSLEYANGNIGLYDRYSRYINDTRTNIVNSIIDKVGLKYKVEGERLISEYKNTSVKLWAENIIIREAALMSQKNLFILSYNPTNLENNGRVMLIQPKGLRLNTHNILFIVNKGNTHFVTFKSDSVGHNQQLTELIQSSLEFITKLTKMVSNRRLCVNLSEIDDEVKESRVNVYSFLLRDFDNALFNASVNSGSVAKRLQQEFNNAKMARELQNLEPTQNAINLRLKQINNNARMARELPATPVKKKKKTIQQKRKEEKNARTRKLTNPNTNSNAELARLMRLGYE